jgi:2-oxoglutarate dehydrogenase E2 component (dihydrolipoamide succinyltransferase)
LDNVNIGITIDVGKGLFVLVIKETTNLSINEISEKLIHFRMKAIRKNFNSEDLDGGSFSISIKII